MEDILCKLANVDPFERWLVERIDKIDDELEAGRLSKLDKASALKEKEELQKAREIYIDFQNDKLYNITSPHSC